MTTNAVPSPAEVDVRVNFNRARDDFLEQLSEQEKAQFVNVNTAQELLDGLKNLAVPPKHRQKWTKLLGAVDRCSRQLEPYFGALDMIAQSYPEWTASAWGAFRIILQLASNFVSFFDRLGEVLARVASMVPGYEEISQLNSGEISTRFRMSLSAFYVDLFEFFRTVARVFTRKTGTLRKSPVVIGTLLWQPFDVRFSNFLKRLDFHREVLRTEADALHFKLSQSSAHAIVNEFHRRDSIDSELQKYNELVYEMKQIFSSTQRDVLIESIRKWINPPCFADAFEEALSPRHEGTAEWLFEVENFKSWRFTCQEDKGSFPIPSFFWDLGNPGTGKTVLAASAVQELRSTAPNTEKTRLPVAHFFFRYNTPGRSEQDHAYRSILAQYLQHCNNDNSILDIFTFAMASQREGQLTATHQELLKVLSAVAVHEHTTAKSSSYIVIDAVDECGEADGLVSELFEIYQHRKTKILFFSRPNVGFLRRKVKDQQTLKVTRSSVESDLRLYFHHQVQHLQTLEHLPETICHEELVKHLLSGADGMFLWARLMISYLKSPSLSPLGRLSVIRKLQHPEKLEEMYLRILGLIASTSRHEQALSRKILLLLTFGKGYLRSSELQDILTTEHTAVKQPDEERDLNSQDLYPDFENTVVMICASLVEPWLIDNSNRDKRCFRFIHHSVLEFFVSKCCGPDAQWDTKPGNPGYFLPPEAKAQMELAIACLSYITFKAPMQPLSGNMSRKALPEEVDIILPFLRYASLNWPSHLAGTQTGFDLLSEGSFRMFCIEVAELINAVSRFLLTNLGPMSWVEQVYTFSPGSVRHEAFAQMYDDLIGWAEWTSQLSSCHLSHDHRDTPPAVLAFANDMAKLHKLWGDALHAEPNQIWNDVTAFTPSPFFRQTSAVSIKALTTTSLRQLGLSMKPLSRISEEAVGTDLLAVLTIWPSKKFEQGLLKRQLQGPFLDDECTGWFAHYEIWDIAVEKLEIMEDWYFPLCKLEVLHQLERYRHLVRAGGQNRSSHVKDDIGLHFPTSIATSLNRFTVLRTVFAQDQQTRTEVNPVRGDIRLWKEFLIPVKADIDSTPTQHQASSSRSSSTHHNFPHLSNPEPKSSWIPRHSFNFKLSVTKDFVLYQSVEGNDILPCGEDVATSVAIFHINAAQSNTEVRFLGMITADSRTDREYGTIGHCTFHPRLPILAFHFRSAANGSKIIVWNFGRQDEMVFTGMQNIFLNQCLQDQHLNTLVSALSTGSGDFATAVGRVRYLQFSDCGTKIIVQMHGKARPTVRDIKSLEAYQTASVLKKDFLHVGPTHPLTQESERFSTDQSLSKSCSLPSSMSQNELVLQGSNGTTQLIFHSGAQHRTVELVRNSGDLEEVQPLLSIPAWRDVENVKVSVRLPTMTREDKITVILNKTAKPYYTLSNIAEEAMPAVIQKDVRALQNSRKRLNEKGMRWTSAHWTSGPAWAELSSGGGALRDSDAERAVKRLREQ